jgi:hypothetical protein
MVKKRMGGVPVVLKRGSATTMADQAKELPQRRA